MLKLHHLYALGKLPFPLQRTPPRARPILFCPAPYQIRVKNLENFSYDFYFLSVALIFANESFSSKDLPRLSSLFQSRIVSSKDFLYFSVTLFMVSKYTSASETYAAPFSAL